MLRRSIIIKLVKLVFKEYGFFFFYVKKVLVVVDRIDLVSNFFVLYFLWNMLRYKDRKVNSKKF